jgi:hypothetical protein
MYPQKTERLLSRGNEILPDQFAAKSIEEILSTPIQTRRQSYQRGEVLLGPIPIHWLTAAAEVSLGAGYVAAILWHLVKMRQAPAVISRKTLQRYGIEPRQGLRRLHALADKGLIRLELGVGRSPRVWLRIDHDHDGQKLDQSRRREYAGD